MNGNPSTRIGIGYDIHRLEAGDGIMLGGVSIACAVRTIAHSDGDVVLHALCDALLGSVAAGDLGEHFPDTDERHHQRPSSEFVQAVLELPQLAGWSINNVDINIIAQTPRLGPHKQAMREHIAGMLGLSVNQVSVKARSNEELDAIGHKQAIAAQAVVLIGTHQ
jgi:2-C-methyl-D-erythritol 2,4-cyclodiphosphate synthase